MSILPPPPPPPLSRREDRPLEKTTSIHIKRLLLEFISSISSLSTVML